MKFVILDRDGVINEDSPDYIKSVAEWRPIPGSLEAIARLCQSGFRVFIASNQSGLGQGLFDYDALSEIHDRLQPRRTRRSHRRHRVRAGSSGRADPDAQAGARHDSGSPAALECQSGPDSDGRRLLA